MIWANLFLVVLWCVVIFTILFVMGVIERRIIKYRQRQEDRWYRTGAAHGLTHSEITPNKAFGR
jgi:hypothetical protein